MKAPSSALYRIMAENDIRQCQLARASRYLSASHLNAIIRGWQKPGDGTIARIRDGLSCLGCTDAEVSEVVAELRQLGS